MKHMKRWIWLAVVPLAAFAGIREDYAQQWPLQLERGDAGAYRVVLTPEVYLQLQSAAAADLQVIDGDGNPVATALVGPDRPLSAPVRKVQVPRFALKAPQSGDAADVGLMVERDTDGAIRNVRTHVSLGDAPATPDATWLVDVSQVRDAVVALELEWPQPAGSFDRAYRLEGSDDLRDWRTLDARVQLVDLIEDGHRLRRNRIDVPGPVRYLRLLLLQRGGAPELGTVLAVLRPESKVADWRWVSLLPEGDARAAAPEQGSHALAEGSYISYRMQGRFLVERAEVATDGNAVVRWDGLMSRDSTEPGKGGTLMNPAAIWRHHARPWVSYQVSDQGQRLQSAPLALPIGTRDRYWMLKTGQPFVGELPRLRLGYRPETLVFVAQGRPPYALAAGSARTQRQEAPLAELIDALRAQRGGDWQPAEATLGGMQPLAGDKALQPAPVERDWKAWVLWGLLVAGALLVAGFAFSLLRHKPAS